MDNLIYELHTLDYSTEQEIKLAKEELGITEENTPKEVVGSQAIERVIISQEKLICWVKENVYMYIDTFGHNPSSLIVNIGFRDTIHSWYLEKSIPSTSHEPIKIRFQDLEVIFTHRMVISIV